MRPLIPASSASKRPGNAAGRTIGKVRGVLPTKSCYAWYIILGALSGVLRGHHARNQKHVLGFQDGTGRLHQAKAGLDAPDLGGHAHTTNMWLGFMLKQANRTKRGSVGTNCGPVEGRPESGLPHDPKKQEGWMGCYVPNLTFPEAED